MKFRKELVVISVLIVILQFYFYRHGYFNGEHGTNVLIDALFPAPVRTNLIVMIAILPVLFVFVGIRIYANRKRK